MKRSKKLKNTYLLKDMATVKSNDLACAAIHPSCLLRSEKLVMAVVKVWQTDCFNPLFPILDAQKLYNISSAVQVEDSSQVVQLLNTRQTGIKLRNCFSQKRLVTGVTSFHSPIEEHKLKLFTSTGRTMKVKIDSIF